ncbi:MAG: NADH-quinone oxidoreductase subunit NuoH [Dehalococcoidia bacterium]|nr:NADH-quinone oxidoreductase subunit NuoH [Dehalococcoidia bacterium]
MSILDYILDPGNIGKQIDTWLQGLLPGWAVYLLLALVGGALVVAFIVACLLVEMYTERKIIGRMQARYGPNRAGWHGVLQPVADAIKIMTKESFVPAGADKFIFNLAPVISFAPAVAVFAVFPFTPGLIFADLNIGVLYFIAISSLSVIGAVMAGWGSNNKYSLLGAMRSVAQMVSYEVPLVLSLLGVVMIAGTMQMGKIVEGQTIPYIILQPIGFLVYMIAAVSETSRSPFDLLEAESELVAGFHTEYSGMKFAVFYLAEYTHMLAVSVIGATIFLGGWQGPVLPPWLWFIGKVAVIFFIFLWLRNTLPRIRVDQLMSFGWKFLLPVALANVFVTALILLLVS